MEWVLIWLVPSAISLFIALLAKNISIFFTTLISWGFIVLIVRGCFYGDEYKEWINKKGCSGDHPWFEWTLCKELYEEAMSEYNPDTYCKISFDAFQRYFQVNPERYNLKRAYAIFDNEDDKVELRMVVPKKDLRKYFEFRRDYIQSRQMVNVLNFVQGDINKMREEAQSYIDKAKEMLDRDFGSDLNERSH